MKIPLIYLVCIFIAGSLGDQAPGGFIEKSNLQSTRRDTFDLSFVPSTRGAFNFPAPYNTRGYRITDASDGEVQPNGYSYWAKISSAPDSDMVLIVAALDITNGVGATVFSINKSNDEVTKVGPLFNVGTGPAFAAAESWYFSYLHPTKMYIPGWNRMYLKDVLTREETEIFDTNDLLADSYAWQTHISTNEQVISFTLKRNSDYSTVGCAVYFVHNSSFVLFDGAEFASYFDECQIDKSGRYLLIKANIDNSYDVDGIFMDLETGEYVTMSDQEGAPGHSDNGFGTVIASDNWAPVDCRFFRYDFKEIIDGAVRENLTIVYNTDGWANTAGCPQHLTWTNAKDTNIVPYEHQFLCGSNLADGEMAKHNEVVCFRPDASLDVLIVAPVLSFANASGGGYYYNKLPKAVIDKAGDYILWSSNMRSDRIDIFVARVPWHLLVAEEDYNPSLESPQTSGVPSTSAAPQTSSPSTSHQKANGGSSSVLNYANLIMIMMSAYSILF